jgi:putative zinc finger protein
MHPLEDWLRAAYAEEEAGCPPPEAFLADEMERLSPEERRRLEEHADRCPACAAERDLARTFDAGPEVEGVRREDVDFVVSRLEAASPVRPKGKVVAFPTATPKEKPSTRPAVWRLAAAAILVLGAGLLFQLSRSGAPPLPSPGTETVVRGGEVEAVSPVGEVPAIPTELDWKPRPGAASYRVRLVAVDDTVLWETTVPAPPVRLPAEVSGQLHRAVVYTWTIEALDASGARVASSEPIRFRARPL